MHTRKSEQKKITNFDPWHADAPEGPARGHEWVWAAFQAMARDGIDGVKVEKLAKLLGISKGPFYWRYANRDALLSEMLTLWKRLTIGLIEENSLPETPRARIESLAEDVLQVNWRGLDVVKIEAAIRAWASHDMDAASVVAEVDHLRVGFLNSQLCAMGLPRAKSMVFAHGLYLGLGGYYAAYQYTPEMANETVMRALVKILLDQAEIVAAASSESSVEKGLRKA